jgi:hypothetical protein
MNDTVRGVTDFFDSYREAFERLDADAIAGHFAFPCHVASDASEVGVTVADTREEWTEVVERLVGMYRAIGVRSARVLEVRISELSPRLAQAVVHWELHDGDGRALYDFDAAYTLAEVDGAFRAAALAHNEMPRYRACADRLRGGG